MCSARDKNPLNIPIAMFGQMLECGFIWTLVIAGLRGTAKSWDWFELFFIVTSKKSSSLCSFSYSLVYCICGSWLLRTHKNSVTLLLLPNRAWESSKFLRNIFGAMSNLNANSMAFFFQGYANNSLIGQPLLKDQLVLNKVNYK